MAVVPAHQSAAVAWLAGAGVGAYAVAGGVGIGDGAVVFADQSADIA